MLMASKFKMGFIKNSVIDNLLDKVGLVELLAYYEKKGKQPLIDARIALVAPFRDNYLRMAECIVSLGAKVYWASHIEGDPCPFEKKPGIKTFKNKPKWKNIDTILSDGGPDLLVDPSGDATFYIHSAFETELNKYAPPGQPQFNKERILITETVM